MGNELAQQTRLGPSSRRSVGRWALAHWPYIQLTRINSGAEGMGDVQESDNVISRGVTLQASWDLVGTLGISAERDLQLPKHGP